MYTPSKKCPTPKHTENEIPMTDVDLRHAVGRNRAPAEANVAPCWQNVATGVSWVVGCRSLFVPDVPVK